MDTITGYMEEIEILRQIIQDELPIRFFPEFNYGRKGYNWGEPVSSSFILDMLGAASPSKKEETAKKCGIRQDDVIAERIIAAGSIDLGNGARLPQETLALWADDVFGQKHVLEFGPRSILTAKVLSSLMPLSLQAHKFPEMIIALEDGEAYLGINKNLKSSLTVNEFMEGLKAGKAEQYLNKVHFKAGQALLVPAYTPHAYGKVRVYEVKATLPEEDKAGTISFFDRLRFLNMRDKWKELGIESLSMSPEKLKEVNKGRENKDILTMDYLTLDSTREFLHQAEASGALDPVDPVKFAVKPVILKNNPKYRNTKLEQIVEVKDRFRVYKYTVDQGATIQSDESITGRGHALLVVKGKIGILNARGRQLNILKKGEECFLTAKMGGYKIQGLEGVSEVFTQYEPFPAHK